ncbi:Gag-pol Polyprotein [Phytophthora cinnamomi]|uniref:Gag-pol Polyprotein n=1 Tax=Phytophthora cinnamomi TaxID=4785 RepID=UPI00355A9DE6|nr:Gag-pol Polyprotein [Phytophthora cinnamomi]
MEFLEGTATLDAERAAIDPDYAFLFGERKTKSFSNLALSLSIKLREEFKGPIETQDPAALYTALKAHFERGKENPIYLKREFYSRMLGKHVPVQQYIDGLRASHRRIAESGYAITENKLGRTILSNCVDVYPTVAIKHTEWVKSNTAVDLDVQDAVIQLETAEQAQREVRRKKRGARGKQWKQHKKPRLLPGPENRCSNCDSTEHWYCNCPKELTPELKAKNESWLTRKNKQTTKGAGTRGVFGRTAATLWKWEFGDYTHVLLQVINQQNNQVEDRFLDEVAYSPNAPANIISQGYMQLQGRFHPFTSLDNRTTWLTKPTLKLELKMRDGIYDMRVPRKMKRVMDLMMSPAASKSKPMTRLHSRMGRIGLETIHKMLEQKHSPPSSPTAAPARRRRRSNVRLHDYAANHVTTQALEITIPASYKEARVSPQWTRWRAAMEDKLRSLWSRQTWRLVRRTETNGTKVITFRWVYALKRDEHGCIKSYKARFVIHGFKQEFGVNFNETYAPVVRFESIRAAIYYAIQHGWDILQYDVKTAFLYGDLDDIIYMEQPAGIEGADGAMVCRLLKGLYELRQAPRIWNDTLNAILDRIGFERLDSDYGMYVLKSDTSQLLMILTVYVDDLLLLGPTTQCKRVAAHLQQQFELSELGPVHYLLGVEILVDRPRVQVIFIQKQYVIDVLRRINMESAVDSPTPQATSPANYSEAMRVLRYLHGTADYGLVMDVQPSSTVSLVGYSDADYANGPDDYKSVSGYVSLLDGNVVSYASRKQPINAQGRS